MMAEPHGMTKLATASATYDAMIEEVGRTHHDNEDYYYQVSKLGEI